MSVAEKIRAYYGDCVADDKHRYRSWEYCFQFFQEIGHSDLNKHRDAAALQLGFYLASWGMYRGSSFLLQYAYTIHHGVIERLAQPRTSPLWQLDFGAEEEHFELLSPILEAAYGLREAYDPFGKPTDTLVTKILLGTLGCVPACDRFFLRGFKSEGFAYSCLNGSFLKRIFRFCRTNIDELRTEQRRIREASGMDYPLMKLVDMYFWQLGFEIEKTDETSEEVG